MEHFNKTLFTLLIFQGWSYSEFKFPGKLDVDVNHAPLRRLTIPITFNSPASYRNVLLAALTGRQIYVCYVQMYLYAFYV